MYYPDVSPGDAFRPSAKRENDISHLLNRMNGIGGGKNPVRTDVLTVQVYNAGSAALPYGAAVNFVSSGGAMAGELIPCSSISDTSRQWGVLTTALGPGEGGTCVVAGPVYLPKIEGSGGECVAPVVGSGAIVSGAQVYSRGGDGFPLLFADSSGGVILLGAGGGAGGGITIGGAWTHPAGGFGLGGAKPLVLNSDGTYTVNSGGALLGYINPYL